MDSGIARGRLAGKEEFNLPEEITKVDTARIVQELDAEIARLTSARNILTAANSGARFSQAVRRPAAKKSAGRKPGGRLTAAGRKRLSELMKKRWAERKKKAASKAK
jgi:hypothetical protein